MTNPTRIAAAAALTLRHPPLRARISCGTCERSPATASEVWQQISTPAPALPTRRAGGTCAAALGFPLCFHLRKLLIVFLLGALAPFLLASTAGWLAGFATLAD